MRRHTWITDAALASQTVGRRRVETTGPLAMELLSPPPPAAAPARQDGSLCLRVNPNWLVGFVPRSLETNPNGKRELIQVKVVAQQLIHERVCNSIPIRRPS
jgi:hypothetical protein